MRTMTRTVVLLALLAAGIALLTGLGRAQGTSEREKVIAANQKFFTALNAMFKGDAEPIKEVWWHDDDIIYMGADGRYNVGWAQTWANWKAQADLEIGGRVTISDLEVWINGDTAMTNQIVSAIQNKINGTPTDIKLRSTSIFGRRGGEWRMVCHHVDVIPGYHGE